MSLMNEGSLSYVTLLPFVPRGPLFAACSRCLASAQPVEADGRPP